MYVRRLSQKPYRRGVGIILINAQHHIFMGKRLRGIEDAWQMPQGGIDRGELPSETARRELKEETGTDKIEFLQESEKWYSYDLPFDISASIWGGRFRGQRQKWFLAQFLGTDADINIHTPHPEFSDWCWMSKDEVMHSIVDFKRDLYDRVFQDLWPY